MKLASWASIPLLLGLSLQGAMGAGNAAADAPMRVEVIPIYTLTLSNAQFLRGESAAQTAVIAGTLRVAPGKGKRPLVILLHGSGGFGANLDFWERFLLQRGISTFSLDMFSGRGITSTVYDQSQLGTLTQMLDVYRSLQRLATHPLIDPSRIALMGFSRGGVVALYASLKRFQKLWNRSGIDPAAYIALYPSCISDYIGSDDVSDHPIRLFNGESDDYVQIAPCRSTVQRLRKAGKDVAITAFPDTWHDFDRADFPTQPRVIANGVTTHCELREQPVGVIINVQTGKPFSYRDACVGRNPHVAYSPSATAATAQAVDKLLRRVFRLPRDGG